MDYSITKSTFEDLEVWKKGRELRLRLVQMVKTFPKDEKYRLGDQIIRAARSVTNNIAEGYGRFHYQETIQFCRHSRGSLYELIDHLIICLDENYIDEGKFIDFKSQTFTVIKILNGYISYLKKQKQLT
ncbi:MAG TPA: four helix bundle protein [Ignavibacteria bacterium]|nr:four helix bundle protein [Ignavibacteria bacterium]